MREVDERGPRGGRRTGLPLRDRTGRPDLPTLPLREARGAAGPLVDTLAAYFDSGCVATAASGRLYLSVRAVTYRLDRVKSLTGFNPLDPAHRFTLQVAVLGARLLGWPAESTANAP